MTRTQSRKELEARITYLEEINRFTIDALEMAASLGDFQTSINKLQEPSAILKETASRVQRLIPFQAAAFYLADENSNFHFADCEPVREKEALREEVEFLIDNGTFAWALRENRMVAVSSKDFQSQMVLHVLATYSRIRGLFVGILQPGEKNIPEVSVALLSIILLNSANALESFELYRMVQMGRDELENRVRERTLELAKTNEKLHQEIVERRRTEKALRESEERYRKLVELSPDAVFIHIEDHYIFGNNAAAKLLGASTPEELIGTSVLDTLHPDFWEISQERIRHMEDNGTSVPRIEGKYIRFDGSVVDVEVASTPFTYQGKRAVQVVARDITERKQAVEAIRQSEERYRLLVENAPVGILTIDTEGRMVDVNSMMVQILGSPSTEALRAMNVLTFPPLIESGIAHNFLRCLGSGEPGTYENSYTTQWGKEVNLRYHLTPIREGEQRVTGVQAILEDVSETRKLETQLQQAQKMEAIGMLAGGVAHDLNNILAGLVSYPDLLLMELPPDSPLEQIVVTIKNSGDRAAAIVQDLLTLARRGVAVQEVLNLNDIVDEYFRTPELEKLQELYPKVNFSKRLGKEPFKIVGSPVHLMKVVANLVLNAAEAMPEGGTVSIITENRTLAQPCRGYDLIKEGEYALLTVADSGIGISAKDLNRIFEPFYTKKVMGRSGTGLGLAVVWGTMRDHKGYIDVQSIEGKGTCFHLYFPTTQLETNHRSQAISTEELLGTEKILIVDDILEQREVASLMLAKLGYAVNTVSSGESALEFLRAQSVDLVVLDMIMDGGIDGLETYKMILEMRPHQKAIVVSGYSETDRVKEAQALGAGPYVKKPFTLEKIGFVVRQELDRLNN